LPIWARQRDGRAVLTLHVQPNARATEFAGTYPDALKIRIATPASDNRANQVLIEFARRELKLARSAIKITHGATSRRKLVEIDVHDMRLIADVSRWHHEDRS